MVFVLLTYGGWNEAAYLSGELQNAKRNMARALGIGVVIVIGLYLSINFAYLHVLGLDAIRKSDAVAADMMRIVAGDPGATIMSIVVVLSALTTLNGTIITGSRSYYALGRDLVSAPPYRHLGGTRIDARQRAAAARRAVGRAGDLRRRDPRRLRGDGGLHRAGVLVLHAAGGDLDLCVPQPRDRRRDALSRAALSGDAGDPRADLPVDALFGLAYAGWGSIVGVVILLLGTPLLFLKRTA